MKLLVRDGGSASAGRVRERTFIGVDIELSMPELRWLNFAWS